MECFGVTAARRRPKERKTSFYFILRMFLWTTAHWEIMHIEAVRFGDGDVVVTLGSFAILPCQTSTSDRLSQITWQKTVKGKAPDDVFLTIQPIIGPKYSNGIDLRFEFIGNLNDKNGTLKFSNVTLRDEGSYTCIFSLFPSGTQNKVSKLVILVPPSTNLMDYTPIEGNEEVPLANCTAAASKPKAEVKWITGSLEGKVREELNETQHANGTTTTWSTLFGKPEREMNGQMVKCVISSEAIKEEILETSIQVHYSPEKVDIIERSKVSFECISEANPNATLIWSRSGQPLPSSVEVVGASLIFSSQHYELSGLYQCVAKNPYGSKHTDLFVHFSTGNWMVSWVLTALLSLLSLLNLLAVVFYCYKTEKLQSCWTRVQGDAQRDATREYSAARTEGGESPAEMEVLRSSDQ